jgi:hypothetical protein
MLVRVLIEMNVEVNDPVLEELREIHQRLPMECGCDEQYDRAVKAVEAETGILFYGEIGDGPYHRDPRIVEVRDTATDTLILEC